MKEKRGLSPIIATVLLISLALVLALIIFLWARGFVSEKVQKFDEPIENSCQNVVFEAEAFLGEVNIVNRGNVPLYGIDLRTVGLGSVKKLETFETTILSGETVKVNSNQFSSGDSLIIAPVILGEANSGKKSYVCGEEFSREIVVR
jgi:flagellin-like protein